VKILHTSDLHLKIDSPERWQALDKIVDKAKENAVDILAICGDLFDTKKDASKSYEKLRKIFSDAYFKTLILPGNHDETFYEEGLYLGDNVTIINQENNIFEFDDVKILAIPFKKEYSSNRATVELLNELNTQTSYTKPNILLFHGELVTLTCQPDDFGEGEKARYMPVELNTFKPLNFQYILAGHFHTRLNILRIPKNDSTYFIYPGSPVSTTKKERGKRKVNLLEVGKEPKELELDTFYYEEIEVRLGLFDEEHPLEKFLKVLSDKAISENCSPIFKVTGFFNGTVHAISEIELKSKLEEVAKGTNGKSNVEFLAKDLGRISNDPLFKKIVSKIKEMDEPKIDEKYKTQLIEIFVEAMM